MPYKKSYRRRRPYRRRPRKTFGRKRRMYRPKPDGMVCHKIHAVVDMLNDASGYSALCVNWAGNGIAAGTVTARVTTQNEFTNFTADYNEYKVKAVKIAIIPMNNVQTAADTAFYYTEMGTDTRVLPVAGISDNAIRSLCDYKIVQAPKPLYRYIRVSKYYAKRDLKWLLTTLNYADVGTIFRVRTSGFALNAILARAMVTWYVEFKGLQL